MPAYLYVAVGGVVGSVGRYWIKLLVARWLGGAFRWDTILVNGVGSFILGFFSTITLPHEALAATADLHSFAMVGVCGGFGTVSFALQTLELLRAGDSTGVANNVLISIALCIAAVILCIVAMMLGHALALLASIGN
jgi:CrcB protein